MSPADKTTVDAPSQPAPVAPLNPLEVEIIDFFVQLSMLLGHRFTHGCECEGAGIACVSGQWARLERAVSVFCASGQLGEETGETLTLLLA